MKSFSVTDGSCSTALAELAEGAATQFCGVCVHALFAVLARG